jgi:flagellar hook-associated protein 2
VTSPVSSSSSSSDLSSLLSSLTGSSSSTSASSFSGSSGGTASVSGLASGLDTASIISQLMAINAQPQTLLKQQLVTVQTQGAAYRDVNSAFAALATAAQALTKAATWQTTKATSSSGSVAASTATGATPGNVSFTVDQLSSQHSVISSSTQKWSTATTAWGLGGLTVTPTDTTKSPITVTPTDVDGDGVISLSDAVASINKNATGYTATAVNTGSGYQLEVTANGTGQANQFSVSTSAGSMTYGTLTTGLDAKITLGSGANAVPITSSTNTFSGVMAGTTLTVSQTSTTPVTVSVTSDPDAIATAVQNMVTAANTALSKIAAYTDSSTGSKAPLKGDWSLISLTNSVLSAVSTAIGTSSAHANGISVTTDGQLQFNATTFKTALAANPAKVQSAFSGAVGVGSDNVANTPDDTIDTDGLAARLQTLADRASDSVSGSLTTLAKGEDSTAKNLTDQISDWNLRLQAQQDTLTAQFNNLETAMSTLKSQSSWLTSQINSLYNPNAKS